MPRSHIGGSLKKRRFISIFRKQLMVACLFALLLATGTSIYQFFSNLEQLEDQSDSTLQQILLVTAGPLEKQLAANNLPAARENLQNLFFFPPILSITLLGPEQQELIKLNRQPAPLPLSWQERTLFGQIHEHFFDLGAGAGTEPTWSIKLEICNARIPTNPGRNLLAMLLSNFLACFVLTFAFFGLLHTLFTRQIIALTAQLNSLKDKSDKKFDLKVADSHQNDEMGVLADTINGLWNSRQELQQNLADHNKFVTTVTAIPPVGLFRTDTRGELIWYN
ncbi:MAG: hypothetical protein L3J63_09235, partial [Geopsychrobacter sp.]|nr:hypothetical protein [Geopsychrobacter sp.]